MINGQNIGQLLQEKGTDDSERVQAPFLIAIFLV